MEEHMKTLENCTEQLETSICNYAQYVVVHVISLLHKHTFHNYQWDIWELRDHHWKCSDQAYKGLSSFTPHLKETPFENSVKTGNAHQLNQTHFTADQISLTCD